MSENVQVFPRVFDPPYHVPAPPGAPVSPAALRSVMGRFATGVVVISVGGDDPHGMTANAFGSVSLEPALVHCCIGHSARMHESLRGVRAFGVSVISAGQEGVARYFADKFRPLGAEQFDVVGWEPGRFTGAPLLSGALAWLECEVVDVHVAGDHSLFLGKVLQAELGTEDSPLLFYQGRFQKVSPHAG